MYKVGFISFLLVLFSCGAEQKVDSAKVSKQETREEDSTAVKADTEKVQKSPYDVVEKTGSYLSVFFDKNTGHPVYKDAELDDLVNQRAKEFVYEGEAMMYDIDYLSKEEMKELPIESLIYYCMKYPASYAQICLAFMDSLRFPNAKIFSRIPFQSTEYSLSKKQIDILKSRKSEVIASIDDYLQHKPAQLQRDEFDILRVVDAWELFPEIIGNASEKNLICYTFLLETMHENKYKDFISSHMYENLYGDDMFYYSGGVESTESNRAGIVRLAEAFYKSKNAQ